MFAIQSLLKAFIPPVQNGADQTFFHQGPDITMNPGQSARIPLGFSLNSLPTSLGLELSPHESLLNKGINGLIQNLTSNDYGRQATQQFYNPRSEPQKTIRTGDSLMKGLLKTVSSTALSVLPFVGQQNELNEQLNSIKAPEKHKKIIKQSKSRRHL